MNPVTDLPAAGGTLLTEQAVIRVGGAGANAALAGVEAGMDVRLIGCTGDDQFGEWTREQLAPAGLDDELVVAAGEKTGLTVVLESPARDRTFLTYLGVNAHWDAAMIPEDALTCENLLLCDYFVAPLLRGAPARRLLETARARGARTFFDTTGAGDACNAGLVLALSGGVSWHQALTQATQFATEIIARPSNDRYKVALPGARR